MVLTLYGWSISACTQGVASVLLEKKVSFKYVEIDTRKGEHRSAEYMKKQPFGRVPVLDDDGFILYESRAISRYIATKYADQGTPLIPTDPKANALFEQAASIEASNFDPSASRIAWEKVCKHFYSGLQTDEAQVEKHVATLSERLDVYEQILSKQKYLAGDELTLADLFHLPFGTKLYAAGHGDLIDSRPHVKSWFEKLTKRESWQAVKDGVKGTA
ncbi:hypothetical protein AX14_013276 [Amanita brunnescens Koide BX004]|nr:hypothetical protein AX14_013276 [Amanita brunnescens Koide BX004]